jgi:ABC-type polysaccharide/polyol phosphate export permease
LQRLDEVYDSSRRPHPLVEEFRSVLQYRELVVQFVSRSLKTRYKRSILGIVWTLLNPLLTMIVLTLVFSQVFRFDIENYPVYILSGLVVWNFFSSTTHSSMGEMMWSSELMHRIYVPKSIFAISAAGTGLVNLLISSIPLFLISLVLGLRIGLPVLVMPAAVFLLVLFALGVGLIISTAAVYFADMLPVYEVLLTLWMYLTPIIYPYSLIENIPIPFLSFVFKLNPMYYLVRLFRTPLFEGVVPDWQTWAIAAAFSISAFLIGGWVFTARANEYSTRL